MIPTFILQTWLVGLLSLSILGGAAYCGREWYLRSWSYDPVLRQSYFSPSFGTNEATALFAAAVLLLIIALAGGIVLKAVLRLLAGRKRGSNAREDPRYEPLEPSSNQRIRRPNGAEIQVNFYGPENGPVILLTHGWTLNSDEWNYMKRELTDTFRLVAWDEPGLGSSTRPVNGDYSIETLANDLKAVLDVVGSRPVILLGHSIGGMIILTFCRLFPEVMGTRITGLVLTNTTYTNPLRTTKHSAIYTALERPVLVPLMYLTIGLSPLLWVMNWLSYLNGSTHLSTKRSSFAGTETWEQIDFAARFQPKASPAVMARGMLGMMRYDATSTLRTITVPVLVVAGDRDTVTKPEASDLIRASVPNGRLETLAPAKHLGLVEHHKRYSTLVRQFADSVRVEPLKAVA